MDVGKVGAYEHALLSEIKSSEPGILEAIRNDREIKKETETKLGGFLDGFTKRFVA